MSSIPEGASPARHSGSFGVLTPIIILAVVWLMIGITYVVEPGFYPFMVRVMVAPFLGLVATLIWWWGFTGLCWKDKLLVTGVFFGALLVLVLPHGQKGMLYLFAALPLAVTAWLAWLAITSWLLWSPRKLGLVAVIVLVIGFFGLLRIKGIDGDKDIRVNLISAGPYGSRAARAINKEFDRLIEHAAEHSPLRRAIAAEDVSNSVLYLCSPLASAVTGQILYVDCGYHAMVI